MRNTLIVAAALFFAGTGCGGEAPDHEIGSKAEPIHGGWAVDASAHPAVVSMGHCTGTFVTDRHLLTAAHCIWGYWAAHLTNGATYRDGDSRYGRFRAVHVHPQYNFPTYDVAVIEFESPIAWAVQPLFRLPLERGQSLAGAEVVGYGCNAAWGSADGGVRRMGVVSYGYADGVFNHIGGGATACPGDSGGPLLFGGTVIGVAAYGRYNLSSSDYTALGSPAVDAWLTSLGLLPPNPNAGAMDNNNGR